MSGFQLKRLGMLMEPEPGNPLEIEGVLNPATFEPFQGIDFVHVDNKDATPMVVFPTGVDRRDDLGSAGRFDVYYGMADSRIGVARLDVPNCLPPGGAADAQEGKV